ncbi:MAG: hypothetical protein AAF357_10820, partial [Verrucomicrobiota bacterium]
LFSTALEMTPTAVLVPVQDDHGHGTLKVLDCSITFRIQPQKLAEKEHLWEQRSRLLRSEQDRRKPERQNNSSAWLLP